MAKLLDGTRVYGSFTANTAVIAGTLNVAPAIAASFDKANVVTANVNYVNTAMQSAFSRANTSNTVAIANVNYVNTAMQASFSRANTSNSVAIANVNYVNTAMQAAFAQANNGPVGANNYLLATIAGANTAVGGGANNYLLATIAGANTAVGTGANTYLLATIAGANTAVGTGANTVGSAAFAAANSANSVAIANVNYVNTAMQAAFSKANSATDIAVAAYANANSKFSSSGGTITGDVNIVGNLTMSGNTVFIDATRLQIDDPLIYLAGNNYTSDIVDIGFIANYVNATGSNVHTGLYREHTDKMYYLFQGYDQEPVNNHIGAMSNNMTLAVLNADMITNNLTLASVNSIVWITAAFDKANNGPVGANNYLLAVIAGANTAVGGGANSVGSAAFAAANSANSVAIANVNYVNTAMQSAFSRANTSNTVAIANVNYVNTAMQAAFSRANSAVVSANLDVVNTTRYAVFTDSITGTLTRANVSYGLTYNPSTNTLTTNNIIATGNVGIGTTSPGYKLDVVGTVNAAALLVNGVPVGGGSLTSYRANVGNSSANTFNIAHNLNKSDVIVQVKDTTTKYIVYPDVQITTENHIVLQFVTAPSTNLYNVIVIGV